MFDSLLHASLAGGWDSDGVHVGLCCKVRDLEFQDP